MSDTNPQNIPNYPGTYYPAGQNSFLQNKENIEKLRETEFEKIVPKESGRSWSSLQLKPKVHFSTQNPHEKIFVLSRKHWIVNLGWITRNFIYSLLPFILAFIFDFLNINLPQGELANRVGFILIFGFYSIILTNVVRDFFDWYFDPYIVTNERILDFTFTPFINYSVAEASLEDIESVKQNTKGILGAIFNYGDITIETAATHQIFTFESAPNPSKLRDIISDLSKVAKTYSYGD